MISLSNIESIENGSDSEEEYFLAIQCAINSGSWSLQGSYGRSMMEAIKSGYCMLGLVGCRDYYGNYIPSRSEVQDGTKGSRQYVVERLGEDWASMIESADNLN